MRKFYILFICLFFISIANAGQLMILNPFIGSSPCTLTAQDLTDSWNETDPGGDIVVDSAIQVTVTTIDKDVSSFLDKDKTADHFAGDFTVRFTLNVSLLDNFSLSYAWGLANEEKDFKTIKDEALEADDYVAFQINGGNGDDRFVLIVEEDGSVLSDPSSFNPTLSTDYYITITRDDDAGANNTGQLKAYLCTTAYCTSGGNLQDTLSVDSSAGEQNNFRYLFQVSSHDASTAGDNATWVATDLEYGLCL